jgi:hypothetical protein
MAKKQNQPQRSKNPTRKWQPLQRAYYPKAAIEQVRREYGGAAAERLQKAQVYQNDRYEVAVHRTPPGAGAPEGTPDLVHLSIKRRDKRPVHDWRDLQRIKNELLGPEHEAVELYPAESRLVDAANQFHLWGFDDPTFRFPIGFQERLVSEEQPPGGRQRPL